MVARSPGLASLRRELVATTSGFLRNVRWTPNVTCRVCGGVTKDDYVMCWNCHSRSRSSGAADLLGFVTYAWPEHQSGRLMYAYKASVPGATSPGHISMLLAYAAVAHWNCIAHGRGTHPDAWTYVPSLRGRRGKHPLGTLAEPFLGRLPYVQLSPNESITDRRSFNPANFVAQRTAARHVFLIDDTWVTGGHIQSASAALKAAGVQQVTALTLARWLDPNWATTKSFINGLTVPFDPDICPYNGEYC